MIIPKFVFDVFVAKFIVMIFEDLVHTKVKFVKSAHNIFDWGIISNGKYTFNRESLSNWAICESLIVYELIALLIEEADDTFVDIKFEGDSIFKDNPEYKVFIKYPLFVEINIEKLEIGAVDI